MSNATPKLRPFAALAALFLLAVSGGCKGFFVNQPDSIAVTQNGTSTLSVAVGTPVQLTATATYSSGSKDVTKSASWSSSTACATVGTNTGVVTAVGPSSSVTITATLAGVQGTITGSTTGGTSQTLSISPTLVSLSSGSAQFEALDSNQVDQAASATWTSSDTSILSFASATGGSATLVAAGSVTVTASLTSGSTCASGSASVTVQ
jgi:hypothetical protein